MQAHNVNRICVGLVLLQVRTNAEVTILHHEFSPSATVSSDARSQASLMASLVEGLPQNLYLT